MATLYITEYAEAQLAIGGRVVQVVMEPPVAQQTVDITGTSTQCTVFNPKTQLVRLNTDTACFVMFGLNPIATGLSGRMSADETELRGVRAGSGMMLAVIEVSAPPHVSRDSQPLGMP